MCYSSRNSVQALVPSDSHCLREDEVGSGSSGGGDGDAVYWEHFPHPPVSG